MSIAGLIYVLITTRLNPSAEVDVSSVPLNTEPVEAAAVVDQVWIILAPHMSCIYILRWYAARISSPQIRHTGSSFSYWITLDPLCEGDPACEVCMHSDSPFPSQLTFRSYVLANDLSSAATAAMKRNIELNGLTPHPPSFVEMEDEEVAPCTPPVEIRVNEGDAW